MPAVHETSSPSRKRARAPETRRASHHDKGVGKAEVKQLCHALAPYGILPREMLRSVAGADQWRQGAFELALESAVRSGAIDPLPGDFFREARSSARSIRAA